ncbi:hypothetical protein B566_EDAN018212, partial [Ephemera danica]
SNSGRKGNPAKTSADVKQQCHKQPPVQSEPLVPSTSGERIPRSSSEIQSTRLFASTLINTNDQRSKQNRGQSPALSVLSTSSQCSSAEKQSNTDKSYASTLKSNLNEHITQTRGQSQPSIQSTQYSNPTSTSRGTTEDQSISFNTNIPNFEYVNCLTHGSTAAMDHYPRGILPRKNKLTGEYHHGPILNESSGNSDDPLDVTGTSSKTNTELQSMMGHGGSHDPGIDTEESKTEKPFRSSKEIEIGLQGAMHSSDIQEQMGTREKKLITNFEDPDLTNQSGYGATSKMSQVNLNLAKSTEEGKQKYINMRQNEEISEFSIKYAKITGKQPQISTPSSQSQSTSVAKQTQSSSAQDVCSQNNHERKNEANCVYAKDSTADKIEMDKSSVHDNLLSDPTTQKPNVCNSYFSKTPTGTSNTPKYTAATSRNSGVSLDNLPQDVGSPLDGGKDVAKHLNAHCKVDNDFDYTHEIEIPNYFYKKAEKEKKNETYLKGVLTSVQGVVLQLFKGSKHAEELLNKSQNLQCASENLQQLINDHKNLHGKVLPDIEKTIKKWDHPPYNEKLDEFKSLLQSVEACLYTCCKITESKVKHMCDEASQLKSKSYRIIEPLSDLCDMKIQIEKLGQQLLEFPKLMSIKKGQDEITENLRLANENVKKNINLLKDMEEKYAATGIFLNMDLKNVKGSEIESLLSKLKMAINYLSGLNLPRYKKESVKKYQDALHTLKDKESFLKRKHLEFVAQKEFEELTSLAKDLKNQAISNKDGGLENAELMKSVESALEKLRTFQTSLIHWIPETDLELARQAIREHVDALKKIQGILRANEIENLFCKLNEAANLYLDFEPMGYKNHENERQMQNEIFAALDTLKSRQPQIEAQEIFEKSYSQTSTILKEVTDFWGPSSKIQNLIKKLTAELNYYLVFQDMGSENLKCKLINVQGEIITERDNLRRRQPIIEALERLATIRGQAERLQEKVSGLEGDMSLLRNYCREVEKLQSGLSAIDTMGNDKVKKEAESVSQTIRNTLLNLEGIELQLENEMKKTVNCLIAITNNN